MHKNENSASEKKRFFSFSKTKEHGMLYVQEALSNFIVYSLHEIGQDFLDIIT